MLEKRASDITLDDIERFVLQQIPECRWLDYKRDFGNNSSVAKIVSAMANAHGGWIIYGIDEVTTNPLGNGMPGVICGVDSEPSPADRIKNICLDVIHPPVVPEIGVVQLQNGKVVLVVRVFESDSAPHEVGDKVYVRIADVSHPVKEFKEATVRELEYLLNRRSKSLILKQRLTDRAHQRSGIGIDLPQLILSCVPAFPDEPIADYAVLINTASKCSKNYFAFKGMSNSLGTAHESVFDAFKRLSVESDGKLTKVEFNSFGLLYYKTIINDRSASFDAATNIVNGKMSANLLHTFLQGAELFYRKADFSGLVELTVALSCKGTQCRLETPFRSTLNEILDPYFEVKRVILTPQILDPMLVADVFREFLWSAGYGQEILNSSHPEDAINSAIKQFK